MAQKSKKTQIAAAALPLFLENGFKGTSIDMVVKTSGVAKATVYNHYPDKAALMLATMKLWVEANKPLIAPVQGLADFDAFVQRQWLGEEAVRLYALVIGEGFRFPAAKKLFWNLFDRRWREALEFLSAQTGEIEPDALPMRLDHHLLRRLQNL